MMLAGHLTVKNDYWYAILMIRDENGRSKQKWIALHLKKAGNKRKAEEMLMKLRQTYQNEGSPVNGDSTVLFSDYMKAWLERMKYQVAPSTFSGYQTYVLRSICPYFDEREITLQELHARDLQGYYDFLLQKGLSPTSVRRHHANLHKALKEAMRLDLIPINPADRIDPPRANKPANDCYSLEEANQLLKAAAGTKLELPIFFALFYGLRRSEVLGLRWGSFDFQQNTMDVNHTVHFVQTGPKYELVERDELKRKASARRFPLAESAKQLLMAAKQKQFGAGDPDPKAYICVDETGRLLRPNYISQGFKKFLKKAGLREICFHDLRHPYVKYATTLFCEISKKFSLPWRLLPALDVCNASSRIGADFFEDLTYRTVHGKMLIISKSP